MHALQCRAGRVGFRYSSCNVSEATTYEWFVDLACLGRLESELVYQDDNVSHSTSSMCEIGERSTNTHRRSRDTGPPMLRQRRDLGRLSMCIGVLEGGFGNVRR